MMELVVTTVTMFVSDKTDGTRVFETAPGVVPVKRCVIRYRPDGIGIQSKNMALDEVSTCLSKYRAERDEMFNRDMGMLHSFTYQYEHGY